MPQSNTAPSPNAPPPAMTWPKATPILAIALVFDGLRVFFDMFWLFGPLLGTTYCAFKFSSGLAASACTLIVGALGIAGAEFFVPFGAIMAMVIGFAGWLTVGALLYWFNNRIYKENMGWFIASLLLSEVPFVNALPFMTAVVWKMYKNQIKIEKVAERAYRLAEAARIRSEQEQQARMGAQAEAEQGEMEQMELEEREEADLAAEEEVEAANDERYEQGGREAANDEQYEQKRRA
jgi:hypothetical protein